MCYSAVALTLCKQCADEFGASSLTRSRRQVGDAAAKIIRANCTRRSKWSSGLIDRDQQTG